MPHVLYLPFVKAPTDVYAYLQRKSPQVMGKVVSPCRRGTTLVLLLQPGLFVVKKLYAFCQIPLISTPSHTSNYIPILARILIMTASTREYAERAGGF